MAKFKKVLLVSASFVLVAAMAIGGSYAYLMNDDSDVNVMTLGNVSIAQHEYERAVENGAYKVDGNSYVLKDFTQGKPLYPIVGDPSLPGTDPGYAGWDSTIVRMTQVASYGSMQVFSGKNAQDKFVTVENTGKTDAYVRTLVAFELGNLDAAKFDAVISISSRSTEDNANFSQPWFKNTVGAIKVDGNNYMVVEFVYHGADLGNSSYRHANGVLPAGDTTYPSLCQVYMSSTATNEDCEAIDGNNDGEYDILVLSQAVQTAGFADAKTALDTAFGKSEDKAAEWFGGVIYEANTDTWDKTVDKTWFDAAAAANATAENPVTFTVDTAEEFAGFVNLANTNSFKNVIVKLDCDIDLGGANWNEGGAIAAYGSKFNGTLDGNGHTIYNLSAGNNWTYANALFRTIGNDVTIKNLTIEGANINNAAASGHNKEYGILVGIVGGGTLTIENVTIRNSSVSCKNAAGILVGGMTEGAIKCKNVVMENCAVSVSSASGKGGAILGDGWSAHDYDYAGVYTDNVKVINCTYTVAGVLQAELPLYNYVK